MHDQTDVGFGCHRHPGHQIFTLDSLSFGLVS